MNQVLEFIKEKKFLMTIIGLSLISVTFFGLYIQETSAEEKFTCPKLIAEEESNEETVTVDIKGAVKKPGVYIVKKDTIVNDVIKLAGGLTADADTKNLNLGKKVTDEMVITVYTKKEAAKEKMDSISETNPKQTSGKISLNKATLEELMTLPGIGEAKAKIIIDYRETCGPFKKKEELKNIKGIGESIYAKLESYITI